MYIVLGLVAAAAWFTHIGYCISHQMYVYCVCGALLFPIGIVHGVMIWFQ
jgi:hypothetical protein